MGLRTYNDAMSILNADTASILMNLIDTDELDPKTFRRKLVRESKRLGDWIWDTFNFETGNVNQEIDSIAKARVILNPESENSIPVPGIGYTATNRTDDSVTWFVIVKDVILKSTVSDGIEKKFDVEPINTSVIDAGENSKVYSWYYTIVIDR